MKAFEARQKSIQPQYDCVVRKVEEAIEDGNKLGISFKKLYPEVIQMLINDGYDITIIIGVEGEHLNYGVSWVNAQEGKNGTLTEKKILSKLGGLGDFLKEMSDLCHCDDDDDEEADDESEE